MPKTQKKQAFPPRGSVVLKMPAETNAATETKRIARAMRSLGIPTSEPLSTVRKAPQT